MMVLIYKVLVGLGMLAAFGLALAAFLWPTVEWWLLCWLQRRRRVREARFQDRPRQALRRSR